MTDLQIYPLTFAPVLRSYLWGGQRLASLYGRELPPGKTAESWEISGHPSGATICDRGFWQGHSLPEILELLGEKLAGSRGAWALRRNKFPLLIKLLDAQDNLSLQVHPGDDYAQAHEGGELGKTEMWYVLHAEPGAELFLGLPPGVSRASFAEALAHGDVASLLHRVPIAAGQAVAVPAGTLHALTAGLVVAEIQQNSDTTYRVWDWGRVDADGKPRQLNVERALDVIQFGQAAPAVAMPQYLSNLNGVGQAELVRSDYFVVEKVRLEAGATFSGDADGESLEIWGCVRGQVALTANDVSVELPAIRWALVPAVAGPYSVTATVSSTCLRVYLP
jgi:mannose-6-phosphate isomerase